MKHANLKPILFLLFSLAVLASVSLALSQRRQPAGNLQVKSPHIVVQKSQRKLLLYSGKRLVRTYQVALGLSPVEDKVKEGDRRTPEGDFRVVAKNLKSQFYLSLSLNYPAIKDAERGLRDKLITQKQHDAIARAIRSGRTPPQTTPLGGKVLIHGGGSSSDWTWGCVALDNEKMRELFDAVSVGTLVRIEH